MAGGRAHAGAPGRGGAAVAGGKVYIVGVVDRRRFDHAA
jgi:hypothetical protein